MTLPKAPLPYRINSQIHRLLIWVNRANRAVAASHLKARASNIPIIDRVVPYRAWSHALA
jgi:hypothetical protein